MAMLALQDTAPNVPAFNCSTTYLMTIKMQSCSRQNFAAHLVKQLFTDEERRLSNVSGRANKQKMDATRIAVVKAASLQMYPLEVGETIEKAWASCITAIDESNRRLNRKKMYA